MADYNQRQGGIIMKNNNWGKTILYVHKYLERITDGIDKLVEREAMNSYYYSSTQENDVTKVANKIIELTERKKRLINLKILTEKCLKEIDKVQACILIGKYINEESCENLIARFDMPERTFFRKLSQAEESFSKALTRYGFNEAKMREYLKGENWIFDVYENFLEDESMSA